MEEESERFKLPGPALEPDGLLQAATRRQKDAKQTSAAVQEVCVWFLISLFQAHLRISEHPRAAVLRPYKRVLQAIKKWKLASREV
jgi:hypothetical protein